MQDGRLMTSVFSVVCPMSANKLEPGYYHYTPDNAYAIIQWRERLADSESDYRIIYYHPDYPIGDQYFFHELEEKDLEATFLASFIPITDPSVLAKLFLIGFQFPLIARAGKWTFP